MIKSGSVKRPKISVVSVNARGKAVSRSVPLISPYQQSTKTVHQEVQPSFQKTQSFETQYVNELLQDQVEEPKCEWKQVRSLLTSAYYESIAPDTVQCCIQSCMKEMQTNYIRCEDCGPFTFFCEACCNSLHGGIANQHLFHKPKIWTEECYRDYNIDILLDRPDHKCSTRRARTGLMVFDQKGRIHHCSIVTCQCETEQCVTLMRHNLWSASVKEPKVAFHLELMNWIEFLLLESAISLQSVCLAIRWKNGFTDDEYNTLYSHLVGESVEEYIFFKNMIRECANLTSDLDDIECPACPKEKGSIFISLDANFGLVRKANGGHSQFGPRYGTRLFTAQTDIDDFVQKNVQKIAANKVKECNSFQAGSVIRTKNKTAKLDQKGVFGAACRHGMPKFMMSMTEGERLAYPIYALNTLLNQVNGTDVKLHVLYDIACLLDTHLKKINQQDKFCEISLAVPIFHAYGHKSNCQVRYSCRWQEGYALTDGEVMERLWSYLRQFANSTKQMTPSHRIDRLTAALLHYARKKKHEMDALLCRNIDKATYMINCCTQELEKIKFINSVSDHNILEWLKWEQRKASASARTRTGNGGSSLNKQDLLSKLHAQAMEYAFVCTLRRKYSSGQAIANRICRTIANVCKNMRKLLSLYNEEVGGDDEKLEWNDVCKPDAAVYKELSNSEVSHGSCGSEVRLIAVDLYLHKLRAEEEVALSREEMINCMQWYSSQCTTLQAEMKSVSSRGQLDCINRKYNLVMKGFKRARALFSRFLSESELPVINFHSNEVTRSIVMEEDLQGIDVMEGDIDQDNNDVFEDEMED